LPCSGCSSCTGICVDCLVSTSSGGVVGVRAKVNIEVLVALCVGANEPSIVLRPLNSGDTPLNGITAKHERSSSSRSLTPADLELHDSAICTRLDDSVERGAVGVLDELAVGDLELGSVGGFTEDRVGSGVEDF